MILNANRASEHPRASQSTMSLELDYSLFDYTKHAKQRKVFVNAYHYLAIGQMTVNHDQFSNTVDRVILRTKKYVITTNKRAEKHLRICKCLSLFDYRLDK